MNTFVLEAMPNSVPASTGVGSPRRRTPYPFATITLPSFTIVSEMPGTPNAFITESTYWSRPGGTPAGAAAGLVFWAWSGGGKDEQRDGEKPAGGPGHVGLSSPVRR